MTVELTGPDAVVFAGTPDGPEKFIAEFGYAVGTFTSGASKKPTLSHHVPLPFRGIFRPSDLANFDPEKEYRTDKYDWVLCYATTPKGGRCRIRALNRYPKCSMHGGSIHPMDRVLTNKEVATQRTSRYLKFLKKEITVDDLDDEELLSFGFRTESGRLHKPRNIPREMVQAMTRAIYDRSLHELKVVAVEASKVLASIMSDETNDPNVRIKAAEAILDRTLGKAPQVVAITGTQAWEDVFEGITSASREQSRAARGLPPAPKPEILEAEVIS